MEEHGEDGAIAQGLEVIAGGKIQKMPRLGIPERRRLAFIAFDFRSLHTLDRIRRHRILITQVFKEGGEGSQFAPNRGACELAPLEVFAPGEDVCAGDALELLRRRNSDEGHELLQVIAVRAARVRVVDVRKPLRRRRHLGELAKLRSRQHALRRRCRGQGSSRDRHGFGNERARHAGGIERDAFL